MTKRRADGQLAVHGESLTSAHFQHLVVIAFECWLPQKVKATRPRFVGTKDKEGLAWEKGGGIWFGVTSFSAGEVKPFTVWRTAAPPWLQNQRGGAEPHPAPQTLYSVHSTMYSLRTTGSIALVQDPWHRQLRLVAADSGALYSEELGTSGEPEERSIT